ncbi:PREDICTED: uncharacterized protein LOC106740889 [Dinoponera quadriceps]|uniref:Uncharacterized protein LOC106740889 n=1 Tax=Dinoponera quadriceps TaxID=609295 RepID=A0A6P3WNW6_DINQU|nr:PREDICTED: uncharacterized protein LOC106740889 [Dinoponera quadriceps]
MICRKLCSALKLRNTVGYVNELNRIICGKQPLVSHCCDEAKNGYLQPRLQPPVVSFCTKELPKNANVFGDISGRKFEYVEMDKFEEEQEKFEDTEACVPRRLKPSPGNYGRMIKSHLKKNDINSALKVFDLIKENRDKPTMYMYNLLIRALSMQGDIKKCFSLYNKAKKRALTPNAATYTSLFNACATSDNKELALEHLNNLRQSLYQKQFPLNQVHYNVMVKAYAWHSQIGEAFRLVDEMMDNRIEIGEITFNSLFHAAIADKENGLRHALTIWHLMCKWKVRRTLIMYDLFLRTIRDCKLGDTKVNDVLLPNYEATRILLKEGEKPDLLASPPFVSTLLLLMEPKQGNVTENSLIRANEQNLPQAASIHLNDVFMSNRLTLFGGIEGFLGRMAADGVKPGAKTITMFLDLIPNTIAAENLLMKLADEKNIPLDIDFYNMLIKRRSMRREYKAAKEVIQITERKSLAPNIMTFGVLALSCQEYQDAKEFLDGMEAFGYRPNIIIMGALLGTACCKNNFGFLMLVMDYMERNQIKPNKKIIESLTKFSKKIPNLRKPKGKGKMRRLKNLEKHVYKFENMFSNWQKLVKSNDFWYFVLVAKISIRAARIDSKGSLLGTECVSFFSKGSLSSCIRLRPQSHRVSKILRISYCARTSPLFFRVEHIISMTVAAKMPSKRHLPTKRAVGAARSLNCLHTVDKRSKTSPFQVAQSNRRVSVRFVACACRCADQSFLRPTTLAASSVAVSRGVRTGGIDTQERNDSREILEVRRHALDEPLQQCPGQLHAGQQKGDQRHTSAARQGGAMEERLFVELGDVRHHSDQGGETVGGEELRQGVPIFQLDHQFRAVLQDLHTVGVAHDGGDHFGGELAEIGVRQIGDQDGLQHQPYHLGLLHQVEQAFLRAGEMQEEAADQLDHLEVALGRGQCQQETWTLRRSELRAYFSLANFTVSSIVSAFLYRLIFRFKNSCTITGLISAASRARRAESFTGSATFSRMQRDSSLDGASTFSRISGPMDNRQRASAKRTPTFTCRTLYAGCGWALAKSMSKPALTMLVKSLTLSVLKSNGPNMAQRDSQLWTNGSSRFPGFSRLSRSGGISALLFRRSLSSTFRIFFQGTDTSVSSSRSLQASKENNNFIMYAHQFSMSDKNKLFAEDEDRIEESSDLSFGELLKLEEKLGTKLYQETVSRKKIKMERKFKQEKQQKRGKNRPHEVSAKIPVSTLREVVKVKKVKTRDPRFDSLCGKFDEKAFKRSYGFISNLRENDLNALKKELKQAEKDPKMTKKIKYLIQRLENQLREEKKLKEKKEKEQQEKKELIESIKRGEKPVFKKKSEKKALDLVSQYEELKESGKLKKHIKRLWKKNIRKDRAKLKMDEME